MQVGCVQVHNDHIFLETDERQLENVAHRQRRHENNQHPEHFPQPSTPVTKITQSVQIAELDEEVQSALKFEHRLCGD